MQVFIFGKLAPKFFSKGVLTGQPGKGTDPDPVPKPLGSLIYISHVSDDADERDRAARLWAGLRRNGYNAFMADKDIKVTRLAGHGPETLAQQACTTCHVY